MNMIIVVVFHNRDAGRDQISLVWPNVQTVDLSVVVQLRD